MTSFFDQPVSIKSLTLKNRVFLAPLAGVSDVPFRRICQELGAGLTYVEMLSSVAIKYKNKRTFEMMARHKSETILGVQVTGSTAIDVAAAVEVLDKKGFDTIDINMGCPVRKVVNSGSGSGFLKDSPRISETVRLCRQATQKPLSVKMRLGYTRENVNVEDTVNRVVQEQADMFTIHGRTRSESYAVPCDLQGIKKGMDCSENIKFDALKVGNGDIFSYSDAENMRIVTGCDAVMVSRGALGNPWVFTSILEGKEKYPSVQEWLDVVLRHISYQEEFYGQSSLASILMRKHLLWYTKGLPNSKDLRHTLNNVTSLDDARNILREYSSILPAQFLRQEGSRLEGTKYDPKFDMDRQLDRGVGDEGL